MLLPKKLKSGDTVGVVAPASPPNLSNLQCSLHFLHQLGLHVKIAPHVRSEYGYLAGTDSQRLEDLHTMFADSSISGIICAGGGYGTSRIARFIDYKLIKRNPKIFWGYSDITFLHTSIQQQTGLVTFHGPMLCSDVGKENFDPLSKSMFQQLFEPMVLTYSEAISPLNIISHGEACGEIVGGNLSLLVNSIGSAYEMDTRNKLLLIEDVGEEPYRIDSFLSQLKLAGKLDQAAGVIIGDFSKATPKNPEGSLTLEQVFNFYFSSLKKPVLSGFKIGHCLPHFAVPLGSLATLSSPSKTLKINPGVQ
ncbi:S66 peptidase family protein [Halobacillus naozhouensis]|uniref:LD-carboxypeptidase n=1 Tax=Halobacillus naozhouensis TaxID=554880 RepID=A0ABY8J044_9BACI|nr:LD-carboxypeptidase [Halobacillus naozhouensis]WFT75872.1 LD-carboxypeptidase [Halobacillus naozhouensis]